MGIDDHLAELSSTMDFMSLIDDAVQDGVVNPNDKDFMDFVEILEHFPIGFVFIFCFDCDEDGGGGNNRSPKTIYKAYGKNLRKELEFLSDEICDELPHLYRNYNSDSFTDRVQCKLLVTKCKLVLWRAMNSKFVKKHTPY
jgi:hypothetical protein